MDQNSQIYYRKNQLFSPLFFTWVKKQNLFDEIINKNTLLTSTEEKVIRALYSSLNQVVKRDTIAQALWGAAWLEKYSEYMIDTTLYRLRHKIRTPYKIATLKNRGYILSKNAQEIRIPSIPLPVIVPDGITPHSEYFTYMNNPQNMRKTLADLFLSLKKEALKKKSPLCSKSFICHSSCH